MSPIITVLLVLVAAAVCGALGFYLGGENRKRTAEDASLPDYLLEEEANPTVPVDAMPIVVPTPGG